MKDELIERVARAMLASANNDDVVLAHEIMRYPEKTLSKLARAAIAELLPLVKAELLAAVRTERLEEPQPDTSDEAYQQAIFDAEAAIEAWEPKP